jgi:hypothetical protein
LTIIEIIALENGAHRNQTGTFSRIPEGWVKIPENVSIPETFPFINLEIKDGELISLTPGEVPEIEPEETSLYTDYKLLQQDITDLQLADIEQEQEITELQLTILEGQA